ncbi:MAG: transglycosylase domain-containing protein [Gemmatimonadales bacterium]
MAREPLAARLKRWFSPAHLRRTTFVLLTAASFAGTLAWGSWTRVCAGNACPSIAVLDDYIPHQTSKIYAADGRLITELGLERRTLLRLEDMPPVLREAFVAVEDKRFYQHHGIDFTRVLGAVKANVMALGVSEGFSTITMQLARNIFSDRITTVRHGLAGLKRKLREIYVARELEETYSKNRILELYLNQINLGGGAYGVETASQRYFGKSARDVTLAEAALLAALPRRPELYNPRRHPRSAVQRRNLILDMMQSQGYITREQTEEAKAAPLGLSARQDYGDVAPYFIEWVRQTLDARFGRDLYEKGMRIYTTLDIDIEQAAERALEAQLENIESGAFGPYRHPTYAAYIEGRSSDVSDRPATAPYLQGAFIVMDVQTGEILAMVGGRDFDDSKFNRATQALRQPGSTFKLFVYSAALRAGHSPNEMLPDEPVSIPMPDGTIWEPSNFEDEGVRGDVTLRQGLASSINLIAIRLGLEIGIDAVVDEAHRYGLTTPVYPVPATFIGSSDVYPLQMVSAYTAPAALGVRAQPIGIRRVEDADGKVLWQPPIHRERVMSPDQAFVLNDMLKAVIHGGTATTAVRNSGFNLPAAGKTGTTNDFTDVWFIGYTKEIVAGVWMGFDKPQTIMPQAQGGRYAAPAWGAFMKEIYDRRPSPGDWTMPAGAQRLMDAQQGILPAPVPITQPPPRPAGKLPN